MKPPSSPLTDLAAEIAREARRPTVIRRARAHLAQCRRLKLVSDWEGCAKVVDFACLVVAAARVLPAGGSIETGVYRGGTGGPLVLVAPTDSFHVSIDPFGLASQSYALAQYRNWPLARRTLRQLHVLADVQGVTLGHYLMDSLTFVQRDLLPRPARFRIVHLDGDHSFEAVAAELSYFRAHVPGPALFILDDHDDHFPGVEEAIRQHGGGMVRVLHNLYDYPSYGTAGFSAWLHTHEHDPG
jgi:hypothetical protein